MRRFTFLFVLLVMTLVLGALVSERVSAQDTTCTQTCAVLPAGAEDLLQVQVLDRFSFIAVAPCLDTGQEAMEFSSELDNPVESVLSEDTHLVSQEFRLCRVNSSCVNNLRSTNHYYSAFQGRNPVLNTDY